MNINKVKEGIINGVYFVAVFLFALIITTQALARKVNSFQTIDNSILFYVDKQDIDVVSVAGGRVKKVDVSPGEHVNKGDLLLELDMSEYNQKVKALSLVADENLSAKTELNTLLNQKEYFNIYAPQDGVVSEISIAEGSYVPNGAKVMTLFSDYNAKLLAYVTPIQYDEIQSKEKISVYSKRLEQVFEIKLNGIGKVTTDYQVTGDATQKIRKYELIFQFMNPDDGAVFIEQESLQFINIATDDNIKRPLDRVAKLWNALILGK